MNAILSEAIPMQPALQRWCHPKKILVLTNLLERPGLMQHALFQAKWSGATVILAHVVACPVGRSAQPGSSCVTPCDMSKRVSLAMEHLASSFIDHGIPCEPVLLRGDATEQVCRLAISRDVDRVIVPDRRARGVERLFSESLAESLLCSLEAPLCTIGGNVRPVSEKAERRITAALSLGSSDMLCAQLGYGLAQAQQASLTLIHVIEPGANHLDARNQAIQKIIELLPTIASSNVDTRILIRYGDPAAEILQVSEAEEHQLIVLGASAEPFVSRVLGNSVIRRVVEQATCPVMTVRAPRTRSEAPLAPAYCASFKDAGGDIHEM